LLEQGRTVLLFPEGTRTTTGEMGAFRPAVAYLALKHGVDVLPVHVDGTYRSMPRGAFVPKNRRLAVRIGEPIPAAKLKLATDEARLKTSVACQKAAQVVQKAVEALRDGRTFRLDDALDEVLGRRVVAAAPKQPSVLQGLFKELETRFQAHEVKQPTTYYF
jgi:long-chain acyl-CoA synthetase